MIMEKLNALGPTRFEHLIQALMVAVYGCKVTIYGDGPDGQREAMIEEAAGIIPSCPQAKGRTIIQAKFKSPDGKDNNEHWLKQMLKKELDAFQKKAEARPDLIPDTWIFFTNLILTPVQDNGGQDMADKYVNKINEEYKKNHGRKLIENIYIRGADTIRAMLDNYPGVYSSFFGQGHELRIYLSSLLNRIREAHPSFTLMRPDEVDARLFPQGNKTYSFEAKGTRNEGDTPVSVWSLIVKSWEEKNNRSIVIEGGGGIGKTVTLLCPPEDIHVPVLYLHLYELVAGENVMSLSDHLERNYFAWKTELERLASEPWVNGPSLLLLLDGFNEVPAEKRWDVLYELKQWYLFHPGSQLITVSRPMDGLNLMSKLVGDPIGIQLAPLPKETVSDYLREHRQPLPPEGSRLWEILGYPLFLTLYLKTGNLLVDHVNGYPLDFREVRGTGPIIWNYLQRELFRKPTDDWILPCALSCEYIMPRIAYEMLSRQKYVIECAEATALIEQMIQQFDSEHLPRHLSSVWKAYYYQHFRLPCLDGVNWNSFILHDLGLLVPGQGKNCEPFYSFPHQTFRDCLAGLYLVNRAETEAPGSFPNVWRYTPSLLALDYAAELMEQETANALWEAGRTLYPSDRATTCAMLKMNSRIPKQNRAELNFSNMDLRGLSLVEFLKQKETSLEMFQKSVHSRNTRLDSGCFRGQGHTGSINNVAITANSHCVSAADDGTLRVWDLRAGVCLHTLAGHTGWVKCVLITTDNRCVSCGGDNTIKVWDLKSGICLHTLRGHTGLVTCILMTTDGRCVSGSSDGTLRVWDIDSEKCRQTMAEHKGRVECISMLDNELCVSGSWDNSLKVWNINTGKCLLTLEEHTNPINCIATTTDGRFISGSVDTSLRVWNLDSTESLHKLEGHTGQVKCLAVTTDNLCVSGSCDGTLKIWDLESGNCLDTLTGHQGVINCVTVRQDGLCISGSADSTLKVWNLQTRDCIYTLPGHTRPVKCIAATVDNLLVSTSDDSSLLVWDLRFASCLYSLRKNLCMVTCIAVASGDICVSGLSDGSLRVWDLSAGRCLHALTGHSQAVRCVEVTEDKLCISGSNDNDLRIWDLGSGRCLRTLEGHTGPVRCVAIISDKLCVSGSDDGTLRVWDFRARRCLRTLKGHTGAVKHVTATAHNLCVSDSEDHSLRVWDIYAGKCLHILDGYAELGRDLVITADALAVGYLQEGLQILDLQSNKCLQYLNRYRAWSRWVAITAGLCVSLGYSTIQVWDYPSGLSLYSKQKSYDTITCMVGTTDGFLIFASDDYSLQIINLHKGIQLPTLKGHSGLIDRLAVSKGGLCVSMSRDRTIRVWNYHAGTCLHVLRAMEVDVSNMVFSEAVLEPEDAHDLWQNGASL